MPYDDSEPVHWLIVVLAISALCALAYVEIARHPRVTCDAAMTKEKP